MGDHSATQGDQRGLGAAGSEVDREHVGAIELVVGRCGDRSEGNGRCNAQTPDRHGGKAYAHSARPLSGPGRVRGWSAPLGAGRSIGQAGLDLQLDHDLVAHHDASVEE